MLCATGEQAGANCLMLEKHKSSKQSKEGTYKSPFSEREVQPSPSVWESNKGVSNPIYKKFRKRLGCLVNYETSYW